MSWCVQELIQAGPHGINQAVAQLLEGTEQKKRDGLGRSLSMARLSSRNSQGPADPMSITLAHNRAHYACLHMLYTHACHTLMRHVGMWLEAGPD